MLGTKDSKMDENVRVLCQAHALVEARLGLDFFQLICSLTICATLSTTNLLD